METSSDATQAANRVVQGLWIGPELSVMEQLSLSSFLKNGHEYHLYVYDEVKNVPAGTTLKDGNQILPASDIFQYTGRPSYAGFANFFRYKLLCERGGWWADTDTVCLKPFDFPEDYVFSTEIYKDVEVVNCGAVKSPAGSEAMKWAWSVCQTKDAQQLVWGETGPKLICEAVLKFSLAEYQKPYYVFCPLGFFEWEKIIEPGTAAGLRDDAYAIHLWNDKWRAAGKDKNAQYAEDCLYEKLKRRYVSE
ncbi:MAG TPA: glycosyltransferase [Pyrinomonadaceae bacterium]|nr:glycosyltransferase [Pyrinomonadaceae bacterium]